MWLSNFFLLVHEKNIIETNSFKNCVGSEQEELLILKCRCLKAKNIDLCNNPLTKESKLDAARRIVKEWTDYDEEIHNFIEKLQRNESDGSKIIQSQKPHADAHTEL